MNLKYIVYTIGDNYIVSRGKLILCKYVLIERQFVLYST